MHVFIIMTFASNFSATTSQVLLHKVGNDKWSNKPKSLPIQKLAYYRRQPQTLVVVQLQRSLHRGVKAI